MPTRIADYYNELQRREGLNPIQLVAEWAKVDTDEISAAFDSAFAASRPRPFWSKNSRVRRIGSPIGNARIFRRAEFTNAGNHRHVACTDQRTVIAIKTWMATRWLIYENLFLYVKMICELAASS
jgi:hypothetical protein